MLNPYRGYREEMPISFVPDTSGNGDSFVNGQGIGDIFLYWPWVSGDGRGCGYTVDTTELGDGVGHGRDLFSRGRSRLLKEECW